MSISTKILKYTGIVIASLLALVIALVLSLQIPAVQNYAKGKLVNYLENKIKTKVTLDRVYIDFPNSLVMENLFLQGQKVDTLLFARKMEVGLNIPKLLKNTADITSIDLQGVKANVVRNPDGTFNFDYIIDAFATKDEEESTSKPFIISLDKINLKDIRVSFIDQQSKNDIELYFKSFDTRVKTFDLENNSYAANDINMDGLKVRLKQDLLEEVADKVEEKVDSLNQKKPMKIGLNKIKLTNFNIDYGDDNSKTFAKIIFKELSTKIDNLNLEKSNFGIDNLYLKGADINAKLFLASENANSKTTQDQQNPKSEESLSLLLKKFVFDDVKVVYDNTAIAPTRSGIDFNHLNFSKMNLEVRNFRMKDGTFAGTVNSAEIQENRGLNIQKLETDFVYEEKQAYLKDLYLQTPKTILRDEVVLNYNSIEQLSANPGAVRISANIDNSKIGFSDILMLAPTLRNTAPFNKYPNAVLNINTRLKGTLNDLNVQTLQLSGLDRLKVNASGTIKNAMNPENLYYDLNVRELSSSAKTVFNLVPKNTIPSNIALPSYFKIAGTAKGTTKIVNTDLKLTSTLGNAGIRASVDMKQKNQERYNVLANLQNLQIGKIIQNKELGAITGQISVKGQSFDYKRVIADLKGNINSVGYQGYTYRNMALNGKINRGAYVVNLDSKDPNANLKILASGSFTDKNPSIKVNGTIQKLDLNKLGFYQDQMILAGNIDGDFSSLNPDAPNGTLLLQNFAISDTKDVYPLQDVFLNAVSTLDSNRIELKSQIADVDLTGKYKLTQIFGSLQQTLNQYYQFQTGTKTAKIDANQYFTFNAKLKDDNLLRRFVPELTQFEPITLTGNYDADSRKLEVNGQIPQVTYGKNIIRNGTLAINNINDALVYEVNLDEFKNESIALTKVNLNGDVKDNLITYNSTTKDAKDEIKFLIAGNVEKIGDLTQISLNPEGLKLNYDNWQVSPDNFIQIGSRGILANNFGISNGGSEILVQSETNIPNSPLNISIKDFKIETITELIKKDSLLAKGNINGTAQLRDLKNNMTFTSDLAVTELYFYGSPVGNLDIKANNQSADLIRADVALSGFENDVRLDGTYNTKSSGLNMNLDINQIQMKTVQGFSMNAIENTEGYLSGNLKIGGDTKAPSVLGAVKFNEVGLEITQLGSKFKSINDEIKFTNRGIDFDDFKINDESGNAIVIDGSVLTQSYKDFAFNLDVDAKNFKVVDSKKDNDKLMYGVLEINTDLRIRGDLKLPQVDGNLAVTDQTDFTIVLPQNSPGLEERAGIVEFIDQDQIALQQTIKADSLTSQSDITGLDVNVNIEVNKEAKISLIIDKANGDFVELQGEAQLTGGIDPSGKTTLVGVYEVEKGGYEMSVSLLKRKFEIEKGSTITWTGEPTTAMLDITAVYRTDAAPLDLLQQQLTGVTGAELNQYKQRIPFNTLLKMNGELLKPVITFDITTAEENNSVSAVVLDNTKAKLDQLRREESEMNKQVFALLLLNRFIGENPFQSETGLSASTLAKQSVSRILSEQLNNLAKDLIGGVELNFDLNSTEDYSSGTKNDRTDLNVGLSKRLFDDRLKVTVGNNFALEGESRQNEQATNIAGDITVEYSISKDGRYMLRAYRKNDYQVALQGQIIETGVGFIITLDYDKFREIFERAKKNKEIRKQIKASK